MSQSKKLTVHIGLPKSFSTYYQKQFTDLEKQNKCVFVGVRASLPIDKWYQSDIEHEVLERALRYDSHKLFRENFNTYQNYIHKLIRRSEELNIPFVLSAENLAMQVLPGEIDVEDKLRRLLTIIGDEYDVNFVCVFRNIYVAIRSLYIELVNLGYGHSFNYFKYETWNSRSHCFLDGLIPYRLASQIEQVRTDKVKVSFYYTDNGPVHFYPLDSCNNLNEKVNKSMSIDTAEQVAILNSQSGVAACLSSLSELHRKYWQSSISVDSTLWHKRRVIKDNIALVMSQTSKVNSNGTETKWESDSFEPYLKSEQKKSLELAAKPLEWLNQYGKVETLFTEL